MQADHPAGAGPEDSEREVDVELPEHEQQQRPALAAVRPLGGQHTDRLDRPGEELELQRAGVLAASRVDEQEPAAFTNPASSIKPMPRGGAKLTKSLRCSTPSPSCWRASETPTRSIDAANGPSVSEKPPRM